MKPARFMVVVAGFTYKTRLSKSSAYNIRRKLIGCVNEIRVAKMPEVLG